MVQDLIERANKVYHENFKPVMWFGRCIFLSWYCDVGTCKFCFRSTIKDRIKHAEHARRSTESILVEAILAKKLGWRIEFLTGGYKIFSIEELVNITRLVSIVYGEKIWLNLGALKKEEVDLFRPYIEGVCASIETVNPVLHNKICPNKPIEPYEVMFDSSLGLKKSITIVIGLGETKGDFLLLKEFIIKHNLDRITFYALKPVEGTPFKEGPSTDDYIWWIANTRINFPKLEIIAGTTARRVDEAELLIKAGANAITKFPITKMFGSVKARKIEDSAIKDNRKCLSNLTRLPNIDWEAEIDSLNIDEQLKLKIRKTLTIYLNQMSKVRECDSE